MKYFLSIGAIFKNESHALTEWLDHYLSQEVEHFYLIDNGSSDDYLVKLQPYINNGLVDLFIDQGKHAQIHHYNNYILPKAKLETEWIGILDLDEFAYAVNDDNIADVLKNKANNIENIGEVICPWLIFGSNGHIQQPESIINGFTKRKYYDHGSINDLNEVKSFVKTDKLTKFFLHKHLVTGIHMISNWSLRTMRRMVDIFGSNYIQISETTIPSFDIVVNHYRIQSRSFFIKNKMVRGRAHTNCSLTMAYFQRNNLNDIEDLNLMKKSVSDKIIPPNIVKILYGISKIKSIDVTKELTNYLSSLNALDILTTKIDIKNLIHEDPYVGIKKKLYIYVENNNKPIIIKIF